MKSTEIKFTAIPSTEEVKAERDRLAYRSRYGRVLRSTIYALVVVAAVAVLLATLFLPVLQVSGDSMNPTLQDKDVIVLVKSGSLKTGDLCGFYWQNKLLLKRVIGLPGDIISLDENGGFTIIPEMHLEFLNEAQRKNVRKIEGDYLSQRRISLYIREDYIKERMLNTIINSMKEFMPVQMMSEGIRKYGIRL